MPVPTIYEPQDPAAKKLMQSIKEKGYRPQFRKQQALIVGRDSCELTEGFHLVLECADKNNPAGIPTLITHEEDNEREMTRDLAQRLGLPRA